MMLLNSIKSLLILRNCENGCRTSYAVYDVLTTRTCPDDMISTEMFKTSSRRVALNPRRHFRAKIPYICRMPLTANLIDFHGFISNKVLSRPNRILSRATSQ